MTTKMLIKVGTVGPLPQYQDGDVVVAPSERRIKLGHIERLCHVKLVRKRRDGKRPMNSLPRHLMEATRQYKFTRNGLRVERTTYFTIDANGGIVRLAEPTVELIPAYQIDVRAYLKNRLKRERHQIFGADGSEFWYGGGKDFSHRQLDKVWDVIEAETSERRTMATYRRWHFSETERRQFLVVPTNTAITDAEEKQLARIHTELDPDWTEPTDEAPEQPFIVIRKRRRMLAYENESLGVELADIRDAQKMLDLDVAVDHKTRITRKGNVTDEQKRRMRKRLNREEEAAVRPGSFERETDVGANRNIPE